MPGLEHSWAHGGHFWARVGAIMAPSATLECHGVTQGAHSDEVPRSLLVEAKGLRQRRGSAEGGEASPPSHAKVLYTIV